MTKVFHLVIRQLSGPHNRRLKPLLALSLLLGLLLPVTAAHAQPITPRHSDPGWQASYWNNPTLSGLPALQGVDNELRFNWGLGSPDRSINPDGFSARWERYTDVTPGTYRFTVTSDDGVRLWLDGTLLIDQWTEHAAQTYTRDSDLGSGHHLIRVEYFESRGAAQLSVDWQLLTSTVSSWQASYYNNLSLSGAPIYTHDDGAINFDWGYSQPAPGVNPDYFSVRWTRTLDLPAGNYRFTMTVDDGARLSVNGHTLIDGWREQPATNYTAEIFLPGGAATVQMEYFEMTGAATAKLAWQRLDGGGQMSEWEGAYFNGRSLTGTPALVRNDREINFDWGGGSPAPGVIGVDNFAVRWSRTLNLAAGNYRFTTTTDDGVRLFVGGQLLIDGWREQPATTDTGDIYLNGGNVGVQMEYFETSGAAVAFLHWERVEPNSDVIVDNHDTGFVKGGDPSAWRSEAEGYGGDLFWSRNNDQARPNYNWGRWYPQLQPGRYEVLVYIPDRFTTSGGARYWVAHAGGATLRIVNQSAYRDQWVSLGVYNFRGTRDDYVSLADVTFEPRLTQLIAWDAVKWEPR
ncbi:MAG: PA14 domain-containing protein [Caldilineaceae bacterium]